MSAYLGDFRTSKTVRKMFNTNAVAGESITMATDGTISAYKDGGVSQSTTGITFTENFDGLTGVHLVAVDTSADGTFYSAGSDIEIVLSGSTIDGKAINTTLFSFSLENRSALMPTTDGRKLDVTAGGEAGIDWANIGSPTTTVNLSGTTVKTATDVETDTADIQSRLPTALVSGRMDSNMQAAANGVITAAIIATDAIDADAIADGAITSGVFASGAITADAIAANAIGSSEIADGAITAAKIADGAIDAATFASGAITADAIATDAIGSAELAASAITEIQSGLSTLDAAGVRSAVGLASANLDTQLDAIPTANENADALLDRANAIETGLTPRGAWRLSAAADGGKLSGAATTTNTIRNAVADSKDRIVATVDADGNRTAITYDLT